MISHELGEPLVFDYTDAIFGEMPVRDMDFMQNWTMDFLQKNEKKWWIAGYLEDRSLRLRGTPMIAEWRIFHLGIDIIAAENKEIFSPFDGEIVESTIEPGAASYGGYVVAKYNCHNEIFYVLFGHLDPESLAPIGKISAGNCVGKIGSPQVNGGWTTHTHVQVLTESGFSLWKKIILHNWRYADNWEILSKSSLSVAVLKSKKFFDNFCNIDKISV